MYKGVGSHREPESDNGIPSGRYSIIPAESRASTSSPETLRERGRKGEREKERERWRMGEGEKHGLYGEDPSRGVVTSVQGSSLPVAHVPGGVHTSVTLLPLLLSAGASHWPNPTDSHRTRKSTKATGTLSFPAYTKQVQEPGDETYLSTQRTPSSDLEKVK